ncbi:hypothetical protein [Joostella sp. CR20]|uniref:hypothetical protein n=1 Tax=Joostella sp. CR20 TaxID=2804312 RepID=UPI00313AB573
MRLPSLFKPRPNKSYNYTPRYYDERKERLEELKRSKEARSDDEYVKGYRRRKSYRDDWKTVRSTTTNRNTRIRLIVIFIFLLMFAIVAIRYINLDTIL